MSDGTVTRVPDSPYKGLAAFGDSELDALLFFGRERDVEATVANVLASRLTILYGPSGVGKSSLLHAGVARRLREQSDAPVVVHNVWAEDPAGGLISSVRAECPGLGATAGLVDTVAAASRGGELYLLLDQFEEYVLYHGGDGPLSTALPELLRRPGLRVNVLIAIRDDALAELDDFTARIPELFANLLRLDRLDRAAGRAAILGPLERYSELSGETFTAEEPLVEAVLDEASTANGVEAPYLQLVLERLWERERAAGSNRLRLETFRGIGGSRAVVHEHVRSALEQLSAPEQVAATRVIRQLVTPSGRKLSHEAADLAEYAAVEPMQLRDLLEELGRRRIVRGVDGTPGAAARYEIFHDVLGPPLLAWQQEHQLRDERKRAARQRRRLQIIAAASLAGLVLVALLPTFALIQRSNARTQAQRARGRELAAQALADLATNPAGSVRLALRAAQLAPGGQTASVLRTSLLALREERVFRLGGSVVSASFSPHGDKLLLAGSNGRLDVYSGGTLHTLVPHGPAPTTAVWSSDGRHFAVGWADGTVEVWPGRASSERVIRKVISTSRSITSLGFEGDTLMIASGSAVRIVDVTTGETRTFHVRNAVEAAALDPKGTVFAVALRLHDSKTTQAELLDARTGSVVRVLPEQGIRSLTFSPDGTLLATGSYDHSARLWSASNGRLISVFAHGGYVLQETFSRDGTMLVTASSDGAAYVWNLITGRRDLLLVGATGGINAVAISPDGGYIVTGATDRFARIYYSTDGRLLAPLGGSTNAITSVGFDASGKTVVTVSSDGTARLWDAQPPGTLATIDTRKSPVQALWFGNHPVSIAGNEARILTTSGDLVRTLTMKAPIVDATSAAGTLVLVDRAGGMLSESGGTVNPDEGHGVTAVAFDTNWDLLVGSASGAISVGCGCNPAIARVGAPVLGLSTGGDRFLVRTANELRVYTTPQGDLVSTIHAAASHATLSPDGHSVATAKGAVAQLWDATTGKLLHTLKGHSRTISALAFSPNGSELVTVGYDHTGVIWGVRDGNLIHRLLGHFFPIYAVNWSRDGHWIVTASQFTAGLWNAATGQLMFYVGRTTEPLTSASFSPVGDGILTGSLDGTARLYECEVCQPLGPLEHVATARLHTLATP